MAVNNIGTREYFYHEAVSFRKRWGEPGFWGNLHKAGKMLEAFTYLYLNTEDLLESDHVLFEAMCQEYDTRLQYAIAYKTGGAS